MRLYWLVLGPLRGRTNERGMRTTLERMKAVVEAMTDRARQPRGDAREARRPRRRARQGASPAAARSTSSATTPAASCCRASGSSCSSTRARAFLELSPLAGWGSDFTVGASVVTGIGVIEGVECMITANDPTVKGGASNPWTVKKIFRASQIAEENGLPTVALVESGGADLPTQKEIFIPGGKLFRDITRSSARQACRRSRWSSATPPPAAPTSPA